jgi:hypothetical protein
MVLQAGDFKLTAVRLVAFTPNLADFKPSALLATVLAKYATRLDGNVQALPLPEDAPPDLPRIQLASKDGTWGFAASPSRITSACSLKEEENSETVRLAGVVAVCREPIEHYVRENDVRVGRLGLVVTPVSQAENPAQTLIERFCRNEAKDADSPDAPLRNSTNFEIHNHKRYELPTGVTANSWVRCRTGTVGKDASRVLTVEQDINTLAEDLEERTFRVEDITSFFDTAVDEGEAILREYFP